jgi:NADPH-dependent 2,4-dienoyl-CoA reductase/sulfur reductase-like enzyme
MRHVVVVGASLAGHHAAATLRTLGYDGHVTVIGSEHHAPYDRYPLSKAFLSGDTDRQGLDLPTGVTGVDWRLGATATGLDLGRRVVVLDGQEQMPFDGLVVASGSRARHRGMVEGLDGAFVLRTVDDAVALRAALKVPDRRVVVVGGGLIGAEIAATAVEHGHETTLVHPGDVPTLHAVGRPVAEHVRDLHRAAGVTLHPRARLRRLLDECGVVTGALLDDGSSLPADLVVMATGTEPNVEWLEGSGLPTEGGLRCRRTLFAEGSDCVVGAGDVVRLPHPLAQETVRVEHWASTRHQAARAVENLLLGPERARALTALPEFGTRIHGARIRGVGFPQVADRGSVVWGSLRGDSAVLALARGTTTVAVVSVNADRVLRALAGELWPDFAVDRDRSGTVEPVA